VEENIWGYGMSPHYRSDKADRAAKELYERWQHRAVRVKIRAQMMIGAFIILSLVSLLVLQAIPHTGDVVCPRQPEWWPVWWWPVWWWPVGWNVGWPVEWWPAGSVCKIHQFFVDIFFVTGPKNGLVAKSPLELVGYALVLSAGVELAYMLYTDGPDEALDPLILGLAAAALLAVSQIKTDKASWEIALLILVLSAAVGFLLYIRHAYGPVERADPTLRERVAALERQLEQANGAPQGVPQEDRESPETVEAEPERAEPRPGTSEAQEGTQRPWWRRWFGG
jgi:hypothetical protein